MFWSIFFGIICATLFIIFILPLIFTKTFWKITGIVIFVVITCLVLLENHTQNLSKKEIQNYKESSDHLFDGLFGDTTSTPVVENKPIIQNPIPVIHYPTQNQYLINNN